MIVEDQKQQVKERIESYLETYKNDEDLNALMNILWEGKNKENALKKCAGRMLERVAKSKSNGQMLSDSFFLVFTKVGVMWKYEMVSEQIGESVQFAERSIAPVEDEEKLDAVALMFASGIADKIKEECSDKDIEISYKMEWLYQIYASEDRPMTMRVWGEKEESSYEENRKRALANHDLVVPKRPVRYRGAVISIRSNVEKKLREL